jgi:hypothetical protein
LTEMAVRKGNWLEGNDCGWFSLDVLNLKLLERPPYGKVRLQLVLQGC